MDPPATAAAQATRSVRECKAQLFHALQRRHRDAWRTYWSLFQQYLAAQTSLEHFHAVAEQLLGPENIALHNRFIVALLQDCATYRPDAGTEESNHAAPATSEDTARVPQSEIDAPPGVGIKREVPQRTESPPDTESANLLIGLGRFVSH